MLILCLLICCCYVIIPLLKFLQELDNTKTDNDPNDRKTSSGMDTNTIDPTTCNQESTHSVPSQGRRLYRQVNMRHN